MSLDRHIKDKEFLHAMRDGGTFSRDYTRLHGELDILVGRTKEEEYEKELALFVSGLSWQPTTGGELVANLLKKYTDEWLATGVLEDGRESPFARRLTRAPGAFAAVKKYEYRHFPAQISWDNGLKRRPLNFAKRLRVSPSVKANKSVRSGQAAPGRSLAGFADHIFSRVGAHRAMQANEQASDTMPKSVRSAARIRAACIFHGLMEAPWRYRLGKCKLCNEYFVLTINPPKRPYVRGMHCPNCKNTASARASVGARRGARQKLLIQLAADVWRSWNQTEHDTERNVWVADQVNAALGEDSEIQRNWVTRHEKDIVAKVKERAHAKAN